VWPSAEVVTFADELGPIVTSADDRGEIVREPDDRAGGVMRQSPDDHAT
jgi:hypothetical protein